MKLHQNRLAWALFLAAAVIWTSCSKNDEPEPEPTFDPPTISLNETNIELTQGETIDLAISVEADAGLSSVSLDGAALKAYNGSSTSDAFSYSYLAEEPGNFTLVFTVEDAQSKTARAEVAVNVLEGVDPGFLLLDFAGEATVAETWERETWDVRTITTFDVTGSFISVATAQSVNSQARLTFAQPNPVPTEESLVLKLEKIPPEGFDNWGGWSHVLFNLGQTLNKELVEALPQWDAASTSQVAGTKVFQLDAYYDATVDPDFSWSELTALADIWNADPAKGYKIDLTLGSYDQLAFGGHDGDGYYIEYESYITEPNTWQTLTFSIVGTGRTGAFYPTKETSVAPDQIDCIKILPAGGYTANDANPVFFKNLRIIDAE